MANAPESIADLDDRDFNVSTLARTGSWGIGAATALLLALLAGFSESGAPRVAAAVSALSGAGKERVTAAPPAKPAAIVVPPQPLPQSQLMGETWRLKEQVRLLAADRDRLSERVATLERTMDDVTGSIRRQEASRQAAAVVQAEPPELPLAPSTIAAAAPLWPAFPLAPQHPTTISPWNDPPATEAAPHVEIPTPEATSDRSPGTPLPPRRPVQAAAWRDESAALPQTSEPTASLRPMPAPSRVAYGVDLGGAGSLDRLRMLWRSLSASEARLLLGLHPLTRVREITRGGRSDVRLIAGPLANADHAARLCAAMLDAGRYCEPSVFRGHRLSLP